MLSCICRLCIILNTTYIMQPVVVSAPPPPPTTPPPANVPRRPGRKWTIVDASYYGIRGAGGIRPVRVSQRNDTRIHTVWHTFTRTCMCVHTLIHVHTIYTLAHTSHTLLLLLALAIILWLCWHLCLPFQVQWASKGTTEEGAKLKRAKLSDIIPWFTVY